MPHFSYVAYDANGKSTRGVIEGSSSVQVIERLQEKGLVVVDVSLSSGGKSRKVKKLTLENQTMFCRTLASYLRTGLPLADSLKILAKQTSERNVAAVFSALLESVEGGKRFSAALGDIGAFRESLVRMVESGEQSGSLVTVLEQSAVQFRLEETLRRKIKVALTYPVAMAVIGIAVVGFLLAYVVPKISALFQELGQKLPLPTRILIAASSFVQDYGLILLLVLLAALLVLRRRKKSLNPPFFRKIRSRLTLSLITSHLSTLLDSGIPLVTALRMSSSMDPQKDRWIRIADMVKAGHRFDKALEKEGSFPEEVVYIIRVGEMGGELSQALRNVSQNNWEVAEGQLERLTSLIEPVMVLSLAVSVGFVVVSILLPIFDLSSLVR
jgi:type II secretory pathway component PulF